MLRLGVFLILWSACVFAAPPKCRDVVAYLSRDPELAALFASPPGTRDFARLEDHVREALAVYHDQRQYYPEGLASDQLMKFIIALHDIGKPRAFEAGEYERQHEYTVPIMTETLLKVGFSHREVVLAAALVSHDVVGMLVQNRISVDKAYKTLKGMAEIIEMPLEDFFALQTLFFVSDAASYSAIRYSGKFDESDGQLKVRHPKFRELAERIGGGGDKLELATYRATPDVVARYRKKWKTARQFTEHGMPRLLEAIFGNTRNAAGMLADELSVLEDWKLPGANQPHYDWTRALWENDPVMLKKYDTEIKPLASGLNKMPAYEGVTHRFVSLPASLIERYIEGETIVEPSFISSSRVSRNDDEYSTSNVFFEFRLKGQAGHDIDFEKNMESEVLINAGTRFRVKKVTKFRKKVYDGYLPATKIVLEEIPR